MNIFLYCLIIKLIKRSGLYRYLGNILNYLFMWNKIDEGKIKFKYDNIMYILIINWLISINLKIFKGSKYIRKFVML